ncbi:Na+/H+ antiporter NhaC family protein [Priestia filamentosa]|jgi:Na+/H+ antiporter NhaC|uniref:Na+/H+ antiporter NhaC family protein n=1 Tax=Priestia filamentosa TaxID=1402861 RepID=UPI003D265EC3
MKNPRGNPLALFPLVLFLGLFLGSGIITGDFYQLPVLVAIIIASVVALMFNRKESLSEKVERFSKGAGHSDIMIMVLIFILAGAFSQAAQDMGAVEATVNMALSILPANLILAGLFVIGAFLSISMGTSVGTIAALGPIGVGLSTQTDISLPLTMATVVGGAMFGDNLSFISDTTIASVRTQQTEMKDKFKVNFFIVLPAAIVTIILLTFMTTGNTTPVSEHDFNIIKVLPYVAVLVTALCGVNVLAVLTGGIAVAGIIGIMTNSYSLAEYFSSIKDGIGGMSELVILSMLIGGMVEIIRHNGGIHYLLHVLTKNISSKKGAEFGIAGLVSLTNMATANNTISILFAGPLARNVADQYDIDRRKSASILDIFACFIQGIIPYGAQMLAAAQFASISPVEILPYVYYPFLIALCGIIAILIGYPRFSPKQKQTEK